MGLETSQPRSGGLSQSGCLKSKPSGIPPRKRRNFQRRLCRSHVHFHAFCILFRNRGMSRERFSRTRLNVRNWLKRAAQALRRRRSSGTRFSRKRPSLCRPARKAEGSGPCRHRLMKRNALPLRSTRHDLMWHGHVEAPQPPRPYPSPLPEMRHRWRHRERPCGSWKLSQHTSFDEVDGA